MFIGIKAKISDCIKVNLGQGDCFVAYDIFRTENVLAPRNDDAFFVLRFL